MVSFLPSTGWRAAIQAGKNTTLLVFPPVISNLARYSKLSSGVSSGTSSCTCGVCCVCFVTYLACKCVHAGYIKYLLNYITDTGFTYACVFSGTSRIHHTHSLQRINLEILSLLAYMYLGLNRFHRRHMSERPRLWCGLS